MPTIAIIGGGPSGLVALKTAVKEHLQDAVLFEKRAAIGGVWQSETGQAWSGMQTNLSKYTCAFSDFPWSPKTQLFPTQADMQGYLQNYVQYHDLASCIRLKTQVTSVQRIGEKWRLEWEDEKAKKSVLDFDFVIVASGFFAQPNIPALAGLDKFQGEILHSFQYKSAKHFQDKKVVVVGGSTSACEIAADISTQASKVIDLSPRPALILPRYATDTAPVDFVLYKRCVRTSLPDEVLIKSKVDNVKTHQFLLGLAQSQGEEKISETSHSDFSSPPKVVISDKYLHAVKSGAIESVRQRIKTFHENTIELMDGNQMSADAVMLCTGYRLDLSFLDKALLTAIDYQAEDTFMPILLHKCMLHPELPNMAFVGMYRGPYFAVMELQARWANLLFSGELAWPSTDVMRRGIEKERSIRSQQPRPQFPHGDYVGFADSLAKEIGALPAFSTLQESNPDLYQQLWAGPVLPAHYRLVGPRKNSLFAQDQITLAMQSVAPVTASGVGANKK